MDERQRECLGRCLADALGEGSEGTMAFVRCLPRDVILDLAQNGPIQVAGWQVHVVLGGDETAAHAITADRAVELREAKTGRVLLLVDGREAGAGMDGIYSAVREITETELFGRLHKAALDGVGDAEARDFLRAACREARRLGGRRALSPWDEFELYACCIGAPSRAGQAIAKVGLWPVDAAEDLDKNQLPVSARVVDRLFLSGGASSTLSARIAGLLLPEEPQDTRDRLKAFLVASQGKPWRDAVREVAEDEANRCLWLGRLQPGFMDQRLAKILLEPWRGKPAGRPYKWSGLVQEEASDLPRFHYKSERGKTEPRLEVRWKTDPQKLPAGTTVYTVSIMTGDDDELLTKTVEHSGKSREKCVFTREDFAEYEEEGGIWQAVIRIHPSAETPDDAEDNGRCVRTEPFVITHEEGPSDEQESQSVGQTFRALVEGVFRADREAFDDAKDAPRNEDGKGFVSLRAGNYSSRVFRPPLIRKTEEDWKARNYAIGRWTAVVREDGSFTAEPEFVPVDVSGLDEKLRARLENTTRSLARNAIEQKRGFVGLILHDSQPARDYVNAWAEAFEQGSALLALAHTIEVTDQLGKMRGLIVLPSHPVRVAWRQAYDELAVHMRYEEGLKPKRASDALRSLDGSYFPAFLPDVKAGGAFAFCDVLGFDAVAMLPVSAGVKEPQATVALLARCLSPGAKDLAPSVGVTASEAIGREVDKYRGLHPEYPVLLINALRPGDGLTVTRALGKAMSLSKNSKDAEEEAETEPRPADYGYVLDLHPSEALKDSQMIGRHLSDLSECRRAGAAAGGGEDLWALDTFERDGVPRPCLAWSKRRSPFPTEACHLTVAFDTFDSSMETADEEGVVAPRPIEGFALFPGVVRTCRLKDTPTWRLTVAPKIEGVKHPAGRDLTDRLTRTHAGAMRATARCLAPEAGGWPVLVTSVDAERADVLRRLHELSDWVLTVDRNAGVEYFDAPREVPDVYETYVIDCVPERHDLDTVQLVTSTSQVDEVVELIQDPLDKLGLSHSPRHCRFLLDQLKALSGRLAMRLAVPGPVQSELIALALFYKNCLNHGDDAWLSPRRGFFVPLDDVRDLLLPCAADRREDGAESDGESGGESRSHARSDLVYVDLPKRGRLRFAFVEIKYRRLLRSVREASFLGHIREQLATTRERWHEGYFSEKLSESEGALRRKRLARALVFYADKGRRHVLEEDAHAGLLSAIDQLYGRREGLDPEFYYDMGYVFCPDYREAVAPIEEDALARIFLFGPLGLDESAWRFGDGRERPPRGPESRDDRPGVVAAQEETAPDAGDEDTGGAEPEVSHEAGPEEEAGSSEASRVQGPAEICLGADAISRDPVSWKLSIHGNPHLMIVGLPGMGKTGSIINICKQLDRAGIAPIVFAYHEDIEDRLSRCLPNVETVDIQGGLGFNPMRVIGKGPLAWVDNVGMLRDIFSSIFPDLGEVQTNSIREAIKQSYAETGYGTPGLDPQTLEPPSFQRFYEILQKQEKPDRGVMLRLGELDDYGFFQSRSGDASSLLTRNAPVIVRVHSAMNDMFQRAMASFILLNLYQNMFLRGERQEEGISHVVVFDEAHRASRLKLLPTMAKECRKYGLALIVSSQAAKDFDPGVYSAIANYLVLRVSDADARQLAKNVAHAEAERRFAGDFKRLQKYTGMFFSEGARPSRVALTPPE